MDVPLAYRSKITSSTSEKVEFVDPTNTSQECSNCGRIVKKPLGQRTHKCPFCGFVMDRDQNAAVNILKKGLQKSKGFLICNQISDLVPRKSKIFACQKSSIFEHLRNVGKGLPEFKPACRRQG